MLQQKRSELLRLLFIVSMLALTVGIVLVLSANDRSVSVTPSPTLLSGNVSRTINFSITNNDGAAINEVRFTKPGTVSAIFCLNLPPSGWTCTNSSTYVEFTGSTIAADGTTTGFNVSINTPSTTGNESFTVRTLDTVGVSNSSEHNITIDADAPVIYNNSMNLSDGNVTMLNASTLAHGTGWVKLQDLTFNITITDVFDNLINASIYYRNTTTLGEIPATPPHPDNASSYNNTVRLTSTNPATGRYNGTIPASLLNNGTKIFFTIVANDSVGNRNVTSLTVLSTNTYNFSVDGAAPLLVDAPNITDEPDAAEDNIVTSSAWLNISIIVNDFGGSGVSRVELNASAAQGWVNMTRLGTSSTWNYTGALTSLGVPFGDQNLTLYFRAFDNVSNVNGSIATFNVLVDDDAPQFAIGLFAPSNTTEQIKMQNFTKSNSSVLNFSILIYGNLNYTGGVIPGRGNTTVATIMGPDGRVYNLSLLSKTATWGVIGNADQMVYSSLWFSAQSPQNGGAPENSLNSTNSTLNTLGCATLNPDGGVCPILINVTDIFGRSNSTNISITLDNVSAAVSNISINATGGAVQVVRRGSVINFSVNANNNILNVTIHNASKDAERFNATVLTAMGGAGNYSIALGANLVCGGGVEGWCTVNFSTVDKALNINRSGILDAKAQGASVTFIVDDSAPLVSHFMIAGADTYNNQTGSGGTMILRSDLNVTITFNVTDQITNVTQARIGNATVRNASFATADIPDGFANTSTLANFGCPTNVESSCILTVAAYDNATIDGSRNSNTTVNLTVTVDDLKPRVDNFTTSLITGIGRNVTSVSTVINFSVNITDSNLPDHNVTIKNTIDIKMNKTGSFNVNLTGASNTSTVTWWAMTSLTSLGCTSDGDCTITVVANDTAGNVNSSVSIIVTADSSDLSINNRTSGATFLFDSTPTFSVNTSKAAICRYSTTGVVGYSSMTTPFDNNGTRHSLATLPSTADGSYEYDVSCVDVAGVGERNSTVRFTIDTINDTTFIIDNSTQNVVYYFDSTPTITVNLTANALCRYSNSSVQNYTTMKMPFDVNGTRHNSFTLSTTADGSYTYYVACATANEQNVVPGTVTFTVDTINDTTVTIDNSTQNVVYYFDSTPTITVNLSDNALCRYSNSSSSGVLNYTTMKMPFDVNGTRHNSFTLSTTTDGSYTYRVACTTANEQNEIRDTVTFTVDTVNDTIISITNFTNTGSTFISATPTVHVNLSNISTCRYSNLTSTNTVFNDMTMPFNVNGTRLNSFTVSGDLRDNDYAYPVACTTANGQNEVRETVRFTVDTTSLWNITIGATGSLSATKDYFTQANRFYTFRLPRTNVLATTTINPRYNVTDVLISVMGSNATQGTAATNNLSVIWAYNRTGDTWTSFVFGRATNTFTNFTSDIMDYYVNFTVAYERIEIN